MNSDKEHIEVLLHSEAAEQIFEAHYPRVLQYSVIVEQSSSVEHSSTRHRPEVWQVEPSLHGLDESH
jgi:uncharacterized protein (DUF2249 family)